MLISLVREMVDPKAHLREVAGHVVSDLAGEALRCVYIRTVGVQLEVRPDKFEDGLDFVLRFIEVATQNAVVEFVLFVEEGEHPLLLFEEARLVLGHREQAANQDILQLFVVFVEDLAARELPAVVEFAVWKLDPRHFDCERL